MLSIPLWPRAGQMEAQLQRASTFFGTPAPPLERTTAVTTVASDGRKIFYNPAKVGRTIQIFCGGRSKCAEAVMLGFMAHEMTHHVFKDSAGCLNATTMVPELRATLEFSRGACGLLSKQKEARANHYAERIVNSYGLSAMEYRRLAQSLADHYERDCVT